MSSINFLIGLLLFNLLTFGGVDRQRSHASDSSVGGPVAILPVWQAESGLAWWCQRTEVLSCHLVQLNCIVVSGSIPEM